MFNFGMFLVLVVNRHFHIANKEIIIVHCGQVFVLHICSLVSFYPLPFLYILIVTCVFQWCCLLPVQHENFNTSPHLVSSYVTRIAKVGLST
jgi:hypothetical protein